MADDITVGLRAPYDAPGGATAFARFAALVDATSIDRVCVGVHVTFKGGRGFDGLLNATALAMMSRRITVQTAVYLLPLRHPVPVARQVASLAALAPGRLGFGVGIGGENPAETRACGVDPATRLSVAMENFYQTPFGKFERYCPCGTPDEIVASLLPYVDAGCRSFNLIPLADSQELAIEGTEAVRAALRGAARAAERDTNVQHLAAGRVTIARSDNPLYNLSINESADSEECHR